MADTLQKLFGLNVRRLREERGWTQEELARLSGINRSYLAGVEKGKRNVTIVNIARIAKALEVSPDTLFGRKMPE